MRERVRESALASLLASKRFVVSVCAAIAMVLGAVSAGASVFTGNTIEAEPREVSAIFIETHGSSLPPSETSLFTKRQTLASHTIAVQPPLYTAEAPTTKEKKGLNLKLNQEVTRSTNVLFYNPEGDATAKTDAPATASPTPAETTPAAATVTPDQTEGEPPTDTGATEEPTQPTDPEASPDPTTESNMNSTLPAPQESSQP